MLYSHVTLLMLRVVDVVAKTSVQASARMLVWESPGVIQVGTYYTNYTRVYVYAVRACFNESRVHVYRMHKHSLHLTSPYGNL